VLADGHLLLLTEDGKLKIAPADTKGFEPVTNAEILSGKCWTVPVLHNNRLYARNLERVAAFDLKP
jgi:outer membrane protein assembly factor BamB